MFGIDNFFMKSFHSGTIKSVDVESTDMEGKVY